NTQACPPISSAWTPFALIVERTCRIGVGIKATSHCKILREENFALPESLDWSQIDPFFPLIRHLLVSHAFQRYHFDSFLYNSLRRLGSHPTNAAPFLTVLVRESILIIR